MKHQEMLLSWSRYSIRPINPQVEYAEETQTIHGALIGFTISDITDCNEVLKYFEHHRIKMTYQDSGPSIVPFEE